MSPPEIPFFPLWHLIEIIMCENFIITERYKSQDFVSFHFVFTVDYIRDKNALYGIHLVLTSLLTTILLFLVLGCIIFLYHICS